MSGTIVELEASVHQRVQKLLAFEDTLGRSDRELVRQHAAACQQCRDDLAFQARLKAVQPAAGPAPEMDEALARLMPRLEPPAQEGRRGRASNWLAWAVAAQFLIIAGLGLQLARQPQEFQLLGSAGALGRTANLIVQFEGQVLERDMQAILASQGARVVDGPTATQAWLLHVAPERLGDTLDALRADPRVSVAEPLEVPQ